MNSCHLVIAATYYLFLLLGQTQLLSSGSILLR